MSISKITREPESFGYVRVSAKGQRIDRQLMALRPFAIPPTNMYNKRHYPDESFILTPAEFARLFG